MRTGYLISMLSSAFLLAGCSNLYDRYFTAEGKFSNHLSGLYNQGEGVCDWRSARLTIVDYIELDNVGCGIKSIEETNSVFSVASYETCVDRSSDVKKIVRGVNWTFKSISKNEIIVKINDQEPQSFQRCG